MSLIATYPLSDITESDNFLITITEDHIQLPVEPEKGFILQFYAL